MITDDEKVARAVVTMLGRSEIDKKSDRYRALAVLTHRRDVLGEDVVFITIDKQHFVVDRSSEDHHVLTAERWRRRARRKTLKIMDTEGGVTEVKALCAGGVAVHRSIADYQGEWVLTHVATAMLLAGGRSTQGEAIASAGFIVDLVGDLSDDRDELFHVLYPNGWKKQPDDPIQLLHNFMVHDSAAIAAAMKARKLK